MEFSTQCPVCEKYLEGSFEATTRHVNMCMDEKQSFKAIDVSSSKITSAAINEKRTFKYCPICFKFFKVTARHLKSCRKVAGIDTKDLIISCGTGPSKPTNQKANKKGAKENKKGKVDRTLTKLNTRGLAKSRKKIVKSNGDLTKLSIKEKKELIRNRIDLIMSNIVCPNNFVSNYFQNELPYLWTLSSLNGTQIKYVVDGFERFCSESQEITDKNETFSFIENFPVPVKETNQEKANTEDHNANISTDSVSSNLSEDKCFDTTANTGMLELPDLTFSTPDKMNDQFDIFAKSDRDSPDIPSSQPVPKSIYA